MVHSQRRLFNLLAIKRKLKGRIWTDFEMAQIQVKSQVLLDHCYLPVRTVHPNGVNLHVSLINDVMIMISSQEKAQWCQQLK